MLFDLFSKCLLHEGRYIHTKEGGDYFIEIDGHTVYIFFEWSNGVEDWINNFDFPATPYKKMGEKWYCHRGFLKVWKAMRDEIEDEVRKICEERGVDKIVCVGYSHGAAMAILATEDMAYIFGDNIKVAGYGFGCPRVLWGRVPRSVKSRLKGFRAIQNHRDIVTHVPPAVFGYKHINPVIIRMERGDPISAHRPQAYLNALW